MNKETRPAHELLLAQLILSVFIIGLVGHAIYERELQIPVYVFQLQDEQPVFLPSRTKKVPVNEFRTSHAVLFQLTVSSAYFFVNLLLYVTNKVLKEPILNSTILILMQDVVFCLLMFACSIAAAVASSRDRLTGIRETEILIASLATLVLAFAAFATATNNVPRYLLKPPAYRNPALYAPVPPSYRFNPLKYGLAPPPQVPVYAPEYTVPQNVPTYVPQNVPTYVPQNVPTYVPQTVPTYVPQTVPTYVPQNVPTYVPQHGPAYVPQHVPAYVPTVPVAAPAPAPYIPPQVWANAQAQAHKFIGRHYH